MQEYAALLLLVFASDDDLALSLSLSCFFSHIKSILTTAQSLLGVLSHTFTCLPNAQITYKFQSQNGSATFLDNKLSEKVEHEVPVRKHSYEEIIPMGENDIVV